MKNNKQQTRIETPIRFFYPTADNWHPNFPRDTVEFRVHVYYNDNKSSGMIRICVSGADDTGMEKDIRLPPSDYPSKLEEIRHWCQYEIPNPVTKEWLLTKGGFHWW